MNYISTFLEKLVSWEAVSGRLEAAKAKAAEREAEEERSKTEYETEDRTSTEDVQVSFDDDE